MKGYVWMKISRDKYELPVAIADSAVELAKLCGTTPGVIYTQRSHYRAGRISFCPWVRVDL